MVFTEWFACCSEYFPSCSPFHSPCEFAVPGFDVHFTFMATFTSVFDDVAIIVISICGVYPTTFVTDWVVRKPVISQRLSSVLVEDFLNLFNIFKCSSYIIVIYSGFIHFKTGFCFHFNSVVVHYVKQRFFKVLYKVGTATVRTWNCGVGHPKVFVIGFR